MIKSYKYYKKILLLILVILFICQNIIISFAVSKKGQNERNNVLLYAKIIDNVDDINEPINRGTLARMIVKASAYKDAVNDDVVVSVCTDVGVNKENAQYIKKAIENEYMFSYLGGFFKPDDYATFNDVARACLVLLGYKNSDFTGNRVVSFSKKFREMKLDENILRDDDELVTKLDVINAIYNTLKENKKDSNNCYGLSIFNKMTKDSDGELVADEYIERKIDGPYIEKEKIKSVYKNIYVNGAISNIDNLNDDIENYGYTVYYVDNENGVLYAYTERADVATGIAVKKDYVNKINYTANNMVSPVSVDIGGIRYSFANEDMKIAFSYTGDIKEDDYIIFIYNKMMDTENSYRDKYGKVYHDTSDDAGAKVKGSITYAFKNN